MRANRVIDSGGILYMFACAYGLFEHASQAVVAELVYALVLGTSLFGDESSSLSDRTN